MSSQVDDNNDDGQQQQQQQQQSASASALLGGGGADGIRAFLVTGLPLDDTTINLATRHLQSLVLHALLLQQQQPHQSDGTNDDDRQSASSRAKQRFKIYFDRNVHRKIRNGAFLVLFPDVESASAFWSRLSSSGASSSSSSSDFVSVTIPNVEAVLKLKTALSSSTWKLCFSPSAGKLRDHFFPNICSFSLRRRIKLDPTATYSLTDLPSATRMAQLADVLLFGSGEKKQKLTQHQQKRQRNNDDDDDDGDVEVQDGSNNNNNNNIGQVRVLDAFACVGGNTLGFLLHHQEHEQQRTAVMVTAVELDSTRCEMLKQNVDLLVRFSANNNEGGREEKNQQQQRVVVVLASSQPQLLTVHNGCCIEYLADQLLASSSSSSCTSSSSPPFDIVFFDPPWGGPQYKSTTTKTQKQVATSAAADSDAAKSNGVAQGEQQQEVVAPMMSDDEYDDENETGGETAGGVTEHKAEEDEEVVKKNKDRDDGPFPRFSISHKAASALMLSGKNDDETTTTTTTTFEELLSSMIIGPGSALASVCMTKLPATVSSTTTTTTTTTAIETWITERIVYPCIVDHYQQQKQQQQQQRERPMPFLFNFGASVRLLCFVQNSSETTTTAAGVVSNRTLDNLVSAIREFNCTLGFRELKPRFFDFEKLRWIELKKWKGSKEPVE